MEIEIEGAAQILITFGGLFLLGLLADLLGRHTLLPRVTLLLLAGVLIGPSGFDWLPEFTRQWFPVLTEVALAMIGFLLGHNLTRVRLRTLGRSVLAMSIGVVAMSALLVFSVLYWSGVPVEVALLLAGIAPATAPAATVDVVHEYRARGQFTDTLLGIVAIDDAWGLMAFSLLLALAKSVGDESGALDILMLGAWDIGAAVALGMVLGLPMAYLTGRVNPGEMTLAEALGTVMLCAGVAVWMEVSSILAAMVMGSVVANFARHHNRPFNAIEGVEWPFLILFFVLAGASLHIQALTQVGWLGIGYIVLRTAGRIIGTQLGGCVAGVENKIRIWMGLALLPQAGVAIGMALLAVQRFPELKDVILPVILGSTVFFELLGPVLTRRALTSVGDIRRDE